MQIMTDCLWFGGEKEERLITLIKIGNEECFVTTNYNESDAIDSFSGHTHHRLHLPGDK